MIVGYDIYSPSNFCVDRAVSIGHRMGAYQVAPRCFFVVGLVGSVAPGGHPRGRRAVRVGGTRGGAHPLAGRTISHALPSCLDGWTDGHGGARGRSRPNPQDRPLIFTKSRKTALGTFFDPLKKRCLVLTVFFSRPMARPYARCPGPRAHSWSFSCSGKGAASSPPRDDDALMPSTFSNCFCWIRCTTIILAL